jgi:glyoxylase-like metal-dependent hydrolase (beta-lactamase superfamily II)
VAKLAAPVHRIRGLMNKNGAGFGRRAFLGGVLAAGGAALARAQVEKPGAGVSPARNPLVYHFKIGGFDAWSISDGSLHFGEGLALMWPEEERPQMKQWLEERGESTEKLPLYINVLVVRIGSELVMFDAGFGPGNNPNLGWVAEGLRQIGIAPEAVTAGFLSHAHADHLAGFVRGGKPAFPNAAFHYLPAEFDFWHQPEPDFSKSRRDRNQLPGMIRQVRAEFEALKPNWQPVNDGTQLFGGAVTVEAAPGHTDGHAIFRIRSGNDSLLHLMDLSHHHGFMFHKPEWNIAFDHDPEQSIATRKKVFASAAAERTRCFGFHVPWPGLGNLVAQGDGYLWHPEKWAWPA